MADAGLEGNAPSDANTSDANTDAASLEERRRVFITSKGFTGDLKSQGQGTDGFSGGDNLCTAAAQGAGLGGSWRAWLSGCKQDTREIISAADRIVGAGPWYLVNRTTLVFANRQAFETGPMHPIDTDENGKQYGQGLSPEAWTGRFVAGWCSSDDDCGGWTVGTLHAGLTGLVGDSNSTSKGWTSGGGLNESCDTAAGVLYCFEE